MNIFMQAFLCGCVLIFLVPKGAIAGLYSKCLTLKESVSKVATPFYLPTLNVQKRQFLHTLNDTLYCQFVLFCLYRHPSGISLWSGVTFP